MHNKGEIATILTIIAAGTLIAGYVAGKQLSNIKARTQAFDASCGGNACTQCILTNRTDVLPFYQSNGWDTSCGNRDKIAANWCAISTDCPQIKQGVCASQCAGVGYGQICGNTCTQCILKKRIDILPFHKSNGWDVTCPNHDAIVDNWCKGVSPEATAECNTLKTGDCTQECIDGGKPAPPSGEDPFATSTPVPVIPPNTDCTNQKMCTGPDNGCYPINQLQCISGTNYWCYEEKDGKPFFFAPGTSCLPGGPQSTPIPSAVPTGDPDACYSTQQDCENKTGCFPCANKPYNEPPYESPQDCWKCTDTSCRITELTIDPALSCIPSKQSIDKLPKVKVSYSGSCNNALLSGDYISNYKIKKIFSDPGYHRLSDTGNMNTSVTNEFALDNIPDLLKADLSLNFCDNQVYLNANVIAILVADGTAHYKKLKETTDIPLSPQSSCYGTGNYCGYTTPATPCEINPIKVTKDRFSCDSLGVNSVPQVEVEYSGDCRGFTFNGNYSHDAASEKRFENVLTNPLDTTGTVTGDFELDDSMGICNNAYNIRSEVMNLSFDTVQNIPGQKIGVDESCKEFCESRDPPITPPGGYVSAQGTTSSLTVEAFQQRRAQCTNLEEGARAVCESNFVDLVRKASAAGCADVAAPHTKTCIPDPGMTECNVDCAVVDVSTI